MRPRSGSAGSDNEAHGEYIPPTPIFRGYNRLGSTDLGAAPGGTAAGASVVRGTVGGAVGFGRQASTDSGVFGSGDARPRQFPGGRVASTDSDLFAMGGSVGQYSPPAGSKARRAWQRNPAGGDALRAGYALRSDSLRSNPKSLLPEDRIADTSLDLLPQFAPPRFRKWYDISFEDPAEERNFKFGYEWREKARRFRLSAAWYALLNVVGVAIMLHTALQTASQSSSAHQFAPAFGILIPGVVAPTLFLAVWAYRAGDRSAARLHSKMASAVLGVAACAYYTLLLLCSPDGDPNDGDQFLYSCRMMKDGYLPLQQTVQLLLAPVVLVYAFRAHWMDVAVMAVCTVGLHLAAVSVAGPPDAWGSSLPAMATAAFMVYEARRNEVDARSTFTLLLSLRDRVAERDAAQDKLMHAMAITRKERDDRIRAGSQREAFETLLGYVCHEIRNPLQAIFGTLSLIASQQGLGGVVGLGAGSINGTAGLGSGGDASGTGSSTRGGGAAVAAADSVERNRTASTSSGSTSGSRRRSLKAHDVSAAVQMQRAREEFAAANARAGSASEGGSDLENATTFGDDDVGAARDPVHSGGSTGNAVGRSMPPLAPALGARDKSAGSLGLTLSEPQSKLRAKAAFAVAAHSGEAFATHGVSPASSGFVGPASFVGSPEDGGFADHEHEHAHERDFDSDAGDRILHVDRDDIAAIEEAAYQMNLFTDDVLQHIALSRGTLTVSPVPCSIRALLDVIAHEFSFVHESGIFPVVEGDVPQVISEDPVRLKQLISHGVTNAVRFSPPGEAIQIRASVVNKVFVPAVGGRRRGSSDNDGISEPRRGSSSMIVDMLSPIAQSASGPSPHSSNSGGSDEFPRGAEGKSGRRTSGEQVVSTPRDVLVIEVINKGSGLNLPEGVSAASLFNPTFESGHTSLGLPICRMLVGLLKGDIGLREADDGVVVFSVELPLVDLDGSSPKAAAALHEAMKTSSASTRKMTYSAMGPAMRHLAKYRATRHHSDSTARPHSSSFVSGADGGSDHRSTSAAGSGAGAAPSAGHSATGSGTDAGTREAWAVGGKLASPTASPMGSPAQTTLSPHVVGSAGSGKGAVKPLSLGPASLDGVHSAPHAPRSPALTLHTPGGPSPHGLPRSFGPKRSPVATRSPLSSPAGPDAVHRFTFAGEFSSDGEAKGAGGSGSAAGTDGSVGEPRPRAPRVLFCDDELVLRKLAARMLSRLQCPVECVDDGDQVLDALRTAEANGRPFDVLLLDIMLVRTNGVTVCRDLRKKHGYATLPIIAATANSSVDDVAKYRRAGFSEGVLAKPYSIEALREILLQHCPGLTVEMKRR